jgi:creatinine amidohydrolase
MRPEQIAQAKARAPHIYVPFGSIEWHGYHNVVGLDAVKAHEQLVGLAAKAGGVVYPAVFFGSGGGHLGWPSTFMFDLEPLVTLVTQLLQEAESDGYQKAILLSGHYPNRSQFLDAAIERYKGSGGRMAVLALVENQAPGVSGDHAAKYETSYMMYLHPHTVDSDRLHAGPQEDYGGADEVINYMVPEYEGHPCYGLVGIDPRPHASAAIGRENTVHLLAFLEDWLAGAPL